MSRALSPSSIELGFDDVTLLRVGESGLSSTIVPIGVDYRPDPLGLHPVEPAQVSRLNRVSIPVCICINWVWWLTARSVPDAARTCCTPYWRCFTQAIR